MSAPIPTDSQMDPSMHLDGEHAEALKNAKVGDKVQFHGHGVLEHMSQREGEDGKPEMSATLRVKKLHHKAKKPEIGRAGGKDAEMQEGGKAAMDDALEAEQSNAQPAPSGG